MVDKKDLFQDPEIKEDIKIEDIKNEENQENQEIDKIEKIEEKKENNLSTVEEPKKLDKSLYTKTGRLKRTVSPQRKAQLVEQLKKGREKSKITRLKNKESNIVKKAEKNLNISKSKFSSVGDIEDLKNEMNNLKKMINEKKEVKKDIKEDIKYEKKELLNFNLSDDEPVMKEQAKPKLIIKKRHIRQRKKNGRC